MRTIKSNPENSKLRLFVECTKGEKIWFVRIEDPKPTDYVPVGFRLQFDTERAASDCFHRIERVIESSDFVGVEFVW